MIYEVYKVGEQIYKKVSCDTPQKALHKVLGSKNLEIFKVDSSKANFCVKSVEGKRNTINYYFVKESNNLLYKIILRNGQIEEVSASTFEEAIKKSKFISKEFYCIEIEDSVYHDFNFVNVKIEGPNESKFYQVVKLTLEEKKLRIEHGTVISTENNYYVIIGKLNNGLFFVEISDMFFITKKDPRPLLEKEANYELLNDLLFNYEKKYSLYVLYKIGKEFCKRLDKANKLERKEIEKGFEKFSKHESNITENIDWEYILFEGMKQIDELKSGY